MPTGETKARGDLSTELALDRTRLASDRTLMAWVRTSLSMISFGFTIFKFFQYLRESNVLPGDWRPSGPRNLGLTLIALGTAFLVVATVEHVLFIRRLSEDAQHGFRRSPALFAALIISAVGLLALVNLIFRAGPF